MQIDILSAAIHPCMKTGAFKEIILKRRCISGDFPNSHCFIYIIICTCLSSKEYIISTGILQI